jgi:5'(3')-deoxyribonucleotidase
MSNRIIAIDVDGTIADLLPAWLWRYNLEYGDDLSEDKIVRWSIHEFVRPICGTKIYDYLKDPTLYDNVQPYPGAIEAIKKIKFAGHRVIYPTVTPIETPGIKYNWLKAFGLIDDMRDYIEVTDKSLIAAHMLIDDRPENLDFFKGTRVLMLRPWNMHRKNDGYCPVNDWEEALGHCLAV